MLKDEEYTDIMGNIIERFYKSDSINLDECNTIEEEVKALEEILLEKGYYALTDEDSKLLEDYAPKLFNTFKANRKHLRRAMRGLVEWLATYRYDKLHNIKSKEIRKKKKTPKERGERLITRINSILKLIGEKEIQKDDKQNTLREELLKARNTPVEYLKPDVHKTIRAIKHEPKTNEPVYTIETYLYDLNLPNKGKMIKKFLAKIQ